MMHPGTARRGFYHGRRPFLKNTRSFTLISPCAWKQRINGNAVILRVTIFFIIVT